MSMLLMLYSIGNLHIVSWGTRETAKPAHGMGTRYVFTCLLEMNSCEKGHLSDARSVYVYSYYRSQILQYVKCTQWINIAKGIAKFCDK